MSVTISQGTNFHVEDQSVKHKLSFVRIGGIDEDGCPNLMVFGQLNGRVNGTTGVVCECTAALDRNDIVNGLSVSDRSVIKSAVAILERELAKRIDELSDEPHDDSDVLS